MPTNSATANGDPGHGDHISRPRLTVQVNEELAHALTIAKQSDGLGANRRAKCA